MIDRTESAARQHRSVWIPSTRIECAPEGVARPVLERTSYLSSAQSVSSPERQILRAHLAARLIGSGFKRHLLTFSQTVESSALNSADVHEHVTAAAIRLDKSITFLAVKPLHYTCRHSLLRGIIKKPRHPPKRTARQVLLGTQAARNQATTTLRRIRTMRSIQSSYSYIYIAELYNCTAEFRGVAHVFRGPRAA